MPITSGPDARFLGAHNQPPSGELSGRLTAASLDTRESGFNRSNSGLADIGQSALEKQAARSGHAAPMSKGSFKSLHSPDRLPMLGYVADAGSASCSPLAVDHGWCQRTIAKVFRRRGCRSAAALGRTSHLPAERVKWPSLRPSNGDIAFLCRTGPKGKQPGAYHRRRGSLRGCQQSSEAGQHHLAPRRQVVTSDQRAL